MMASIETLLQAAEYLEHQATANSASNEGQNNLKAFDSSALKPPPPQVPVLPVTSAPQLVASRKSLPSEQECRAADLMKEAGIMAVANRRSSPTGNSSSVTPGFARRGESDDEEGYLTEEGGMMGPMDDAGAGPSTSDASRTGGATGGTRMVHNQLEKFRRAVLKDCFEKLRSQLPFIAAARKVSNLAILKSACKYMHSLKQNEKQFEHELERLAREKISLQTRVAILKKEISMTPEGRDIDWSSYDAQHAKLGLRRPSSEDGGLRRPSSEDGGLRRPSAEDGAKEETVVHKNGTHGEDLVTSASVRPILAPTFTVGQPVALVNGGGSESRWKKPEVLTSAVVMSTQINGGATTTTEASPLTTTTASKMEVSTLPLRKRYSSLQEQQQPEKRIRLATTADTVSVSVTSASPSSIPTSAVITTTLSPGKTHFSLTGAAVSGTGVQYVPILVIPPPPTVVHRAQAPPLLMTSSATSSEPICVIQTTKAFSVTPPTSSLALTPALTSEAVSPGSSGDSGLGSSPITLPSSCSCQDVELMDISPPALFLKPVTPSTKKRCNKQHHHHHKHSRHYHQQQRRRGHKEAPAEGGSSLAREGEEEGEAKERRPLPPILPRTNHAPKVSRGNDEAPVV